MKNLNYWEYMIVYLMGIVSGLLLSLRYITCSLLMHVLGLGLLSLPACQDEGKNGNGKTKAGEDTTTLKIIPRSTGRGGFDCHDYYFGIGLTTIPGNIVDVVTPGYPADLAGIKSRDVIIQPLPSQIIGEPGTVVTVLVMRDGQPISFTMLREKICEGE